MPSSALSAGATGLAGESTPTPPLRFVHAPDAQRVVFGRGASRSSLADELGTLGGTRVLLLASARTVDRHTDLVRGLGDRIFDTFTDVQQHVPETMVYAARDAAASADALLAIGGGSAIGAAKAVALEVALPIVAVPTTYAGSEATSIWGMTAGGHKTTGRDEQVRPQTVVYDPELTTAMPVHLTTTSGMNAVAHCVDALWTSNLSPLIKAEALWAVDQLARTLSVLVREPETLQHRETALAAAWLAGRVLHHAGSALHHKICHVLGGQLDLPHAATHAVVLPYVVAFNAGHAPEVARALSGALGTKTPATHLHELNEQLGVPHSLAELGMPKEGLDAAVRAVVAAAPSDNPRPVTEAAVRGLLTAAWHGDAPAEP